MTKIKLKAFLVLVALIVFTEILIGQEAEKITDYQSIDKDSITIQNSIPKVVDSATVYVSFFVNTSGEISKVKAFRISCKKCNKESNKFIKKEAMKEVFYLIPDINSFPMKIKFKMPVKFTLLEGFNENPSENIKIKRPNAQQKI